MSNTNQNVIKNNSAEVIDIKYFQKIFNKHWIIFVLSVSAAFIIAFLNNKLSTPVYEVDTSILINQDNQGAAATSAQILQELGIVVGSEKNFANELLVLKSYPLVAQAIHNLDFRISYFENTTFSKTKDLYKSSPFVVLIAQDHPQPVNFRFNLTIEQDGQFTLEGKGENVQVYSFSSNNITQSLSKFEINRRADFDTTIQDDFYKFKIIANKNFDLADLTDKKYSFVIQNESSLVRRYQNRLNVEPPDLESTVARLFLRTSTPEKAIDFLTELTNSYLLNDIEQKKHASLTTIEYINDQLNVVKDSLNVAERNLQQFRSSNQVINLSMQSEQIYEELRELQKEKAEIEVKLQYFEYIKKQFRDNEEYSDLITPSAMGINDAVLNKRIEDLIDLNGQRNSFIENNQEKSPYLKKINIEIENLRNVISDNINYIENTTKITINNLNSRITQINTSINQMPETQRELFGIERKFNINDAIYTFLLQKKAEAEIAKASFLADADIISPPNIVGGHPVSPKKMLNYILALFLGFGIPFFFIRSVELLRSTIFDKDEVTRLVDLPIIGKIYHNNKDTEAVIKKFPKSHISESFRKLSLNMDYFLTGDECKVISVNSTISGEGKSLISQNLAQSLSDKGLRTILIGFDIRKPRMYPTLINSPIIGLSSYLSSKANIEDIIHKTHFVNLDVIYAGDVPPNPFELVASAKTNELISALRENYDYIVIDTPPVGVVSEGFILMEKSDLNLFIVRLKRTPKEEFKDMLNELSNKNLKPALIINDIPLYKKKKTGYGYYEI